MIPSLRLARTLSLHSETERYTGPLSPSRLSAQRAFPANLDFILAYRSNTALVIPVNA